MSVAVSAVTDRRYRF